MTLPDLDSCYCVIGGFRRGFGGGLAVMMWCKDGRGGVEDCGRLSVHLWPIAKVWGL
jgi:hypothetical protein